MRYRPAGQLVRLRQAEDDPLQPLAACLARARLSARARHSRRLAALVTLGLKRHAREVSLKQVLEGEVQ